MRFLISWQISSPFPSISRRSQINWLCLYEISPVNFLFTCRSSLDQIQPKTPRRTVTVPSLFRFHKASLSITTLNFSRNFNSNETFILIRTIYSFKKSDRESCPKKKHFFTTVVHCTEYLRMHFTNCFTYVRVFSDCLFTIGKSLIAKHLYLIWFDSFVVKTHSGRK